MGLLSDLFCDCRFAIRILWSRRLFALPLVASLAVAIGATTAVFSFVEAVLLRPLPFRDPGRLVLLWGSKDRQVRKGISGPDFQEVALQSRVFDGIAEFRGDSGEPLQFGSGDSQAVTGLYVDARFFELLGSQPFRGRVLAAGDYRGGAERVVVISHSFWNTYLGADPNVVGREIRLQNEPYLVAGVMDADFFFPDQHVQMWLPLPRDAIPAQRNHPAVHAIARLNATATPAHAQQDLDAIVQRLTKTYSDADRGLAIGAFSLDEELLGQYRHAFWSLGGGAGLLLLVACANAAHLLLARGMTRGVEISTRLALGAPRYSIFRLVVVENLLLAFAGGASGLGFAFVAIAFLRRMGLSEIPRLASANLNPRVVLFALALTTLSGFVIGLWPALRAMQPDVMRSLRQGGVAYSYCGWRHLPDALMTSQIALGFVLVVSAGLLTRSFIRLTQMDWGFQPDHVLVVDVWGGLRMDLPARLAFAQNVLIRLKDLPGVTSVAFSRGSPIKAAEGFSNAVTVSGSDLVDTTLESVGPDYFRTLGIPVRGREFSVQDDAGAPKVAVISKTLAGQLWPGQDPLGKQLKIRLMKPDATGKLGQLFGNRDAMRRIVADPSSWDLVAYTVIGEARPVLRRSPTDTDTSAIYADYRQISPYASRGTISFFLRTPADPMALAETARHLVRTEGGNWAMIQACETLAERVKSAMGGRGTPRLLLIVVAAASGVGLTLAAFGIYSVIAFHTAMRTREIGVRMAFGAQNGHIFAMILRRALARTAIGLAMGMSLALVSTKLLASYLFGIKPTDPATLAAVGSLFAVVSFLACVYPARRAVRIDPTDALRYE